MRRLLTSFLLSLSVLAIGCGSEPDTSQLPLFSVAANPSDIVIVAGGKTTFSVRILDAQVAGPYTIQVSGLPAGITVNSNTGSATPQTPATFTLTAQSGLFDSGGNLLVTAAETSLTGLTQQQQAMIPISIAGIEPPAFDLSTLPDTSVLTLVPGAPGTSLQITQSNANRLVGPTSLSFTPLPNGVTSTPPLPTQLAPDTPVTVVLSASLNAPTNAGDTVTVTATNGPVSETQELTVEVFPIPPGVTYALSASLAQMVLVPGATRQDLVVSLTPYRGFDDQVVVSQLNNLPSGITAEPQTFTLSPQHPSQVITVATAEGTVIPPNDGFGSLLYKGQDPNNSTLPLGQVIVTYALQGAATP